MNKEDFLSQIAPRPFLVFKEYDFEKRMESLIEIAITICPDFKLDAENSFLFENGIKYFAGDKSSAFPLNKGLLLYGPFGTGKSLFFKLMSLLIQGTFGENGFQTLSIDQIIDGLAKHGQKYFIESPILYSKDKYGFDLRNKHLFIDDIGLSTDTVNYYGNNIDPVFNIIQRRYVAFTEERLLTHISTNLKPELFSELYGEAVGSRIKQMFFPVALMGKDRRK